MARDPRTKPFRVAVMTLFAGFSVAYVSCVVWGVVLSLLHQGALPPAIDRVACVKSIEACGTELKSLRTALDQSSCEFQRTGVQAERRWDDWIADWQRQLTALRLDCCLGEKGPQERAPLGRAALDLEKLGRLYTTQMVQYAHEVGPTAERCAGDLAVIPTSGPAPTNP